jgi:hypothetical protein
VDQPKPARCHTFSPSARAVSVYGTMKEMLSPIT